MNAKVKMIIFYIVALLLVILVIICKKYINLDKALSDNLDCESEMITDFNDSTDEEIKNNDLKDDKIKDKKLKDEDLEDKINSNNKIIVIDPGHANHSNLEKEKQAPDSNVMKIKDGGGAEGINTKTPEYEVNMKVANKLKYILESKGYKVIMTKTDNSVSLGNIERAEVGNNNNAALVLRIHADSAENSSANGASMLIPAPVGYAKNIADISKSYGQIILNSMTAKVGMVNRGLSQRNDMTGFNWSKVPVVLVEMGFMSNPKEDKLLASDNYQSKLADGLADGICNCIK